MPTDIGGEVLVLAAEDVTGLSPAQGGTARAVRRRGAPRRSTAAGYTSDVYDFDTQGRKAPHPLGVLSHYNAVVWETGDDIILRAPGQVPGTAAKAALDIELAVRDYLNEGGKLLVGGKYALLRPGRQRVVLLQPVRAAGVHRRRTTYPCLPLLNDFQQYWLGAYTYVDDGGTAETATPFPLTGTAGAFTGFTGRSTRRLGGEPGPHRVVPDHVELPAAGAVPAVRQFGAGGLAAAGRRAVRPAYRRLVRLQRAVRRSRTSG